MTTGKPCAVSAVNDSSITLFDPLGGSELSASFSERSCGRVARGISTATIAFRRCEQ
jgi:hypothetical protein